MTNIKAIIKNILKFLLLIFYILLSFLIHAQDNINFLSTQIPFSSDPLDFDYYIHQYSFSSVYLKLVRTEKIGEIVPGLASSWSHSADFKEWNFALKTTLTYSNGDKILPNDYLKSFKRIAFIMHTRNSKSGIVEFIEGIENLNNLNQNISGLYLKNNTLYFKFIKPMPNFLSLISFGLYGLTHPSLYDNDGKWKDKHKTISSSTYEVSEWDHKTFKLKLRSNIRSENNIKEINFITIDQIHKAKDLEKIAIFTGDKLSLMVDSNFDFYGSQNNMKIGYAICNSWNKIDRICYEKNNRLILREMFYNSLKKDGLEITNSFLPKNLTGVVAFPLDYQSGHKFKKHYNLITHPINISGKIEENSNKKSISEIFKNALFSFSNDKNINLEIKDLPSDNSYDVFISGTGIESSDYIETLKFMFLSKEGIKLPDSSGIIIQELKKERIDINLVNKEIWNQAIVWPIRHYSTGFWVNRNIGLDFSEVNLDSASIDFQFLKFKKWFNK